MYDSPEIGKIVTVVTDWSDMLATSLHHVQCVYSEKTHTGTVVKNEHFDDPASFNMTTGTPGFPVCNIQLHRVISLEYDDGAAAATVDAIDDDSETWTVPGSNGNEYVVTRNGNTWGCECRGWQFRSQCKHVNEKKAEVLGRSK